MTPDRRAESVFLAHLARHGSVDDEGLAALCASHPDLAEELRQLRSDYELAASLCRRPARGAEPSAAPAGEPQRLHRYAIRGEVGRGGMGIVHAAWDPELRRVVAVKSVRQRAADGPRGAADETSRLRLLEEAQVLGQLQHPGVVPVFDLGADEHGDLFFTMPLVHGEDFASVIERVHDPDDDWNLARAVAVLQRVAETMAYAHSRGVLHRDLKPSNLMVGAFGESYVMDWGLAKLRGGEETTHAGGDPDSGSSAVSSARLELAHADPASPLLSVAGQVVGTPAYMPPEQARGDGPLDERADVYAVGAILYQLLAGRAPYRHAEREPYAVTLRRVCDGAPTPLADLAPLAPEELVAICERAMARDRDDRYPTMTELAADLRAHLEGRVVTAHRRGALVELRKWMGRHRGVVAMMAVLLAVLVSAAVVLATLYDHASSQRHRAEQVVAMLRQNPAGHRIDYSGKPTLQSFVEDFDDGVMAPFLRVWWHEEDLVLRDGHIELHRRRNSGGEGVSFGLDPSEAVMRGDFDVGISFEVEGFEAPPVGAKIVGLNLRRARDGQLVGYVQFVAQPDAPGPEPLYAAATAEDAATEYVPWPNPSGGFRIARSGGRITASCWRGRWESLLEGGVTEEPLQLTVYATVYLADEAEFVVAFDDLRYDSKIAAGRTLGPVVESFDHGLGSRLVSRGDGGVAAAIDGKLQLMNFEDATGRSYVRLDPERYSLLGDFDLSFALELLEFEPDDDGELALYVSLSDGGRTVPAAALSWSTHAPGVTLARSWAEPQGVALSHSLPRSCRVGLRRTGAAIAYAVDGGGWRQIATVDGSEPLGLEIGLSNIGSPAGGLVTIDELHIEGLHQRY